MCALDWKEQELGTVKGFTIELGFRPEFDFLTNSSCFCAVIIAKMSSFVGKSHLSGCIYANKKEALGDDPLNTALGGYMPQLIGQAIAECEEKIQSALSGLGIELIQAHLTQRIEDQLNACK